MVLFGVASSSTKTGDKKLAVIHKKSRSVQEDMKWVEVMVVDNAGENIHLKILVPSIAAGAIIGKGGETIAQVQKEAGARVKMSKANDFYPGTTERVCLIMGPVDAVRRVHNFIMEKIREKPDPNPKLDETKTTFERHRQVEVKILVPNSTAGMIIGKAGNFIKQIKEESGAYVQISQKSKETNLPERCVTVAGESTGDLESNRKAMDMILQKIVEDPQSGSCPNISYADYTGPVASANPTGSPFANTTFIQNRSPEMAISNNNFAGGGFGFGVNGNAPAGFNNNVGVNFNLNAAAVAGGGAMSGAAIDNLKLTLRNSGFTDQATEEISAAMSTLANYGILGMGLGIGGVGNIAPSNLGGATGLGGLSLGTPTIGATSMMASSTTTTSSVSNAFLNTSNNSTSATSLFGPVGSGSSGLGSSGSTGASSSLFGSSSPSIGNERYGSSPMLNDSFSSTVNYQNAAPFSTGDRSPNMNQNSFGLGTGMYSPTDDKAAGTTKQEIEVSESIVGAILGPGGKGIVEIQQFTGSNIQISKKGVYAPGTRNRIVSITGTPSNITKAQYMIQQRIQQEEFKRARQASAR
ncbi:RNA-binding protein Pasilla-like isoform X5 [Haliotis rufescens]|uniref:RNA-binding protein Pasilla-like isoform X5 n=1 Tax=Haliotis rufescens TaxID=6454 RepID=UPI00201EB49C|nr:RNA-binding protein Pasilla-like isoform X5 [Haliotis rufescens]